MTVVTYFPPSTVKGIASVQFDTVGKFLLKDMEGLAELPNSPATTRAPFQPGTTLLDNQSGGKTVTIRGVVWGDSHTDRWVQRDTLAHVFSVVPRFDQRVPELGTLRLSREGQDDIDLECTPVDSPVFSTGGPLFDRVQVDLFAPSPWWTSPNDIIQFFVDTGGISIPHTSESPSGISIPHTSESPSGLAIDLGQGIAEINNDGHAPTPLTIEVEGEVDTPRLSLEETSDSLELSVVVASGETYRIKTEFGEKEVTKIIAGVESNAFDKLNTSRADFFWLQRGANTLTFTFTSNTSGQARVAYRKRYAGA